MKTKIGYKLFEQNKSGELYPLFINKNEEVILNKWIKAESHQTKGFAFRPGWHIGDIPDAPWLKSYDGTDIGFYRSRFAKGKRVWCMVEYNATNDYTSFVNLLPGKSMSEIPNNGFYFFKEVGRRTWSITSDIRVIKILTESEQKEILKNLQYDEVESYKRYKVAFEKRMHKDGEKV